MPKCFSKEFTDYIESRRLANGSFNNTPASDGSTMTIGLPPQEPQTEFNLHPGSEAFADPTVAAIEGRIETDRHSNIIISPAPFTHHALNKKRALYFNAGAKEVWFCEEDARMRFFNRDGAQVESSSLYPEFPAVVRLSA